MELSNQILSDITVYMKYAKFLPIEERRETWEELVTRNKEMHQKKYPKLKEVMVEWYNNNKLNHKLQKLPMGRKKKLEG